MNSSGRNISFGLSVLLSITTWTAVIFFTILCFLIGLFLIMPVSGVFDRGTRRLMHSQARFWAKAIIFSSGLWRLRVFGREHIVPGKNYVVVANHQSLMDILAVLAGLPLHFKFLAKQELFPIPFFGWHMKLTGYIPLDRASHESGRKAMKLASQWLQKGVSVLFFPEGTRSLDGEIHAFKIGSFKIARDENIDILPLVIDGTGDAMPKKAWRTRKISRFIVSIGKPVPCPKKSGLSIEALRDRVRQEMIERLAQIRAEKGS